MKLSDVKDMTSRCDVCGKPFTIILVDGKIVDPEDKTRHVETGSGEFMHARCVLEE